MSGSSSSSSSSGSMSSSTCSKTSSSRPLVAKDITHQVLASVAISLHRRSGILTLVILMRKKNGTIVTTKIGTIPSSVLPDLTPTLRNGG